MKRLVEHTVRVFSADTTSYNRIKKERDVLPLKTDGEGDAKRIWFIELPIVIETKETIDEDNSKNSKRDN